MNSDIQDIIQKLINQPVDEIKYIQLIIFFSLN